MATDFFDRQDDARRQTRRLVFYYALAVILIILAIYAAFTAILVGAHQGTERGVVPALLDPIRLAIVAAGTGSVILLGSLYKILTLREGGAAVARMLGGRLVDQNTSDPAERRLLNVVEEMAIASGVPVPPVYMMDDEQGINAFAAGFAPGDAVIGMTRGSLEHLSRDQLQGVIAHEFSHILNGDMRLDLKLLGILHGILLLAILGEILMRSAGSQGRYRSRNDDKKDNSAMMFLLMGVALYAIGFLGVFFGRLIKSAVSRQREFLADASAVQFTRNPEGLAGALKKIGGLSLGSKLVNPNAEQACHMFFSLGVPAMSSLLATHPPLEERIKRLDPQFDGNFAIVEEDERVDAREPVAPPKRRDDKGPGNLGGMIPGMRFPGGMASTMLLPAIASVGSPRPEHVEYANDFMRTLPAPIAQAVREPFGASAVVYALLLDPGEEIRAIQFQGLAQHAAPGLAEAASRLAPILESLGPETRVPIVDLAIPSLKLLSDAQYKRFRGNIDPLIRADNRVSLFEFTLQRMLLRHLDRQFRKEPQAQVLYSSLPEISGSAELVLSALSWAGGNDPSVVAAAFSAGVAKLGMEAAGLRLVDREKCLLSRIGESLDVLVSTIPPLKKTILEACVETITSDGQVTVSEGELLRAIADTLDCPMPPLIKTAS